MRHTRYLVGCANRGRPYCVILSVNRSPAANQPSTGAWIVIYKFATFFRSAKSCSQVCNLTVYRSGNSVEHPESQVKVTWHIVVSFITHMRGMLKIDSKNHRTNLGKIPAEVFSVTPYISLTLISIVMRYWSQYFGNGNFGR